MFVEFGGNGLLGSVNYDRQLGQKPGFGFRVGVGVYGIESHLTVPLGVNYLFRLFNSRSFVDVGLGATFSKANVHVFSPELSEGYIEKKPWAYLVPSAGLRACTTKNFVWRLHITPIFTEFGLTPYLGIGFGKRF